jgi:beta-glucosidase
MMRLKQDGVPIVGFTWYSLTDQMDWDTVLLEDDDHCNELGLYDLNRKIRPAGHEYRTLVAQWKIPLRQRQSLSQPAPVVWIKP